MKNPSETVAERIVAALQAKGILLPASANDLTAKLAAGRVTSSDWTTVFRLDQKMRKQNAEAKTPKH